MKKMLFEVPKIRRGVVKKDAECEIGIQKLRFSRFPALPIGRNYITSLPLEMSLDRLRQSYGTKSISKTITASYSGPNVSILSYDIFTNTERSSCYSRPCIAKAYRMCLTETEYTRDKFNLPSKPSTLKIMAVILDVRPVGKIPLTPDASPEQSCEASKAFPSELHYRSLFLVRLLVNCF